MRRKFEVAFTIEMDVDGRDVLTPRAVADHVKDLEWSGGCKHPDFSLHSNKRIKVANVKAKALPAGRGR